MSNLIYEGFNKVKRIVPVGVSMFLMSGCSSVDTESDLYQKIKMQTDQFANTSAQAKEDSVVYWTEKAYEVCNTLKSRAPYVIVISVIVGALLLHLINEDQGIRQRAVAVFIIGIPFLTLLLTYGLSWLVGTFL